MLISSLSTSMTESPFVTQSSFFVIFVFTLYDLVSTCHRVSKQNQELWRHQRLSRSVSATRMTSRRSPQLSDRFIKSSPAAFVLIIRVVLNHLFASPHNIAHFPTHPLHTSGYLRLPPACSASQLSCDVIVQIFGESGTCRRGAGLCAMVGAEMLCGVGSDRWIGSSQGRPFVSIRFRISGACVRSCKCCCAWSRGRH